MEQSENFSVRSDKLQLDELLDNSSDKSSSHALPSPIHKHTSTLPIQNSEEIPPPVDLTNHISFGKYKNKTLAHVLSDRNYCKWLLQQSWFIEDNEKLYTQILLYDPSTHFISKKIMDESEFSCFDIFIEKYPYFNLPVEPPNIELCPMTETDKIAYNCYRETIIALKQNCIALHLVDSDPFNISGRIKWINNFSEQISLDILKTFVKQFIQKYDLLSFQDIIREIKSFGGINYKGGQSYLIAARHISKIRDYWREILKQKYGSDMLCNYKYQKHKFDFVNIIKKRVYQCKLDLMQINEDRICSYNLSLNNDFEIIYLINKNYAINMTTRTILYDDLAVLPIFFHQSTVLSEPNNSIQIDNNSQIIADNSITPIEINIAEYQQPLDTLVSTLDTTKIEQIKQSSNAFIYDFLQNCNSIYGILQEI